MKGFLDGSVVESSPTNAGDTGSILVREDPSCCGPTKPLHRSFWAWALEPWSLNLSWAHILEAVLPDKRSHRSEKHTRQLERSPISHN